MGAYILKEKLKGLKARLKQWNAEVFGDLSRQGKELTFKLDGLDMKAEDQVFGDI